VLVFERGQLVEDGSYDTLSTGGACLPRLVA
jgi:hypothetical protein